MKILDRKIARYTEQAVKYLPVYLRFGAQKEMAELVRQMLEDYSGKKEPDILDLREVLAEIGRPSERRLRRRHPRHRLHAAGLHRRPDGAGRRLRARLALHANVGMTAARA